MAYKKIGLHKLKGSNVAMRSNGNTIELLRKMVTEYDSNKDFNYTEH